MNFINKIIKLKVLYKIDNLNCNLTRTTRCGGNFLESPAPIVVDLQFDN